MGFGSSKKSAEYLFVDLGGDGTAGSIVVIVPGGAKVARNGARSAKAGKVGRVPNLVSATKVLLGLEGTWENEVQDAATGTFFLVREPAGETELVQSVAGHIKVSPAGTVVDRLVRGAKPLGSPIFLFGSWVYVCIRPIVRLELAEVVGSGMSRGEEESTSDDGRDGEGRELHGGACLVLVCLILALSACWRKSFCETNESFGNEMNLMMVLLVLDLRSINFLLSWSIRSIHRPRRASDNYLTLSGI